MTFGRSVHYRNYGYPDAMVLKISTRKGESGGPVFNLDGELAGMVVSRILDLTPESRSIWRTRYLHQHWRVSSVKQQSAPRSGNP